MTTTTQRTWRKSTRSADTADCVEIASDLRAVRDSKNATGPVLPVPVASFVSALRSGILLPR